MEKKSESNWFFICCCLLFIVICALFVFSRHSTKVVEKESLEVYASGKPIITSSADSENDNNTTTYQTTPETTCLVSETNFNKQSDGSVIASFVVTGINPGPTQTLYVIINAPGILPVNSSDAVKIVGPPPMIYTAHSSIQVNSASADIQPPTGKFTVTTKVARPVKITLDCRVI
jgi:hypothetical protein